jgi:hypothetical protein
MLYDKALQLADDLHKFADFVEVRGDELPDISIDLRSYVWDWALPERDDVPKAIALAMRAGMKKADKVTKEYTDNYFRLFLHFGSLEYKVICNRDDVCTKRVTGSEMVTKQIPPDGKWTEETVEQDIVEWDCNPLLDIATDRD